MAELAAALATLALLRYRPRPTVRNAAVVGALIGVAALSRAELAALVPAAVHPDGSVGITAERGRPLPPARGPRWGGGARPRPVGGIQPLALRATGVHLDGTGCDVGRRCVRHGIRGPEGGLLVRVGCGAQQVAITVPPGADPGTPAGRAAIQRAARAQLAKEGDESVRESEARHHTIDYIRAHEGRFPVVVLARVGRLWGVFRPWQTATFDAKIEGRGLVPARLAMVGYSLLAVASIPGLLLLFRRRQPVAPFVALAFVVTFAAATSFGVQRYRAPFDVVMPVLAAASRLEALWSRARASGPMNQRRGDERPPARRQPRRGALRSPGIPAVVLPRQPAG